MLDQLLGGCSDGTGSEMTGPWSPHHTASHSIRWGEKAAGTSLVTSEGHCTIDGGQGVEKDEVNHGLVI